MGSLWKAANRDRLRTRLARLTPDMQARWGKFTCPQMLAHVNDGLRMALGELKTKPKKTPLKMFPMKQLVIYLLPWPRGAPTAPELLARIDRAQFQHEQDATPDLLERLGSLPSGAQMPEHPAFGHLSRRAWGFLGYRHVDHHFKQFGV